MGLVRSGFSRLSFALLAFVVFSHPSTPAASAQQGATASIVGQVTDESRAILPGVTVTAMSPALQLGQVSDVTNQNGEYRLTTLPIGTYTVEFSLPGFRGVRREGVVLNVGFTAKIDIVLAVGQLEETVTVSGASPVVDVAQTSVTTHVTQDVLAIIPTGRNGYTALLELAPGARGNIDVGGSTNNGTPSFSNFGMQEESWQAVEGVSTKTPNISDSGNFPDFSTIEEAAITTMGHDASVPSRGVAINTIVKSGGNDYHGTFLYGGTNSSFESKTAVGGALKFRDDLTAQIGGPIMRDKIWFFVGYRYQRQERYVINAPNAVGAKCLREDGSECVRENKSPFLTPKVTFQLNPTNKVIGMAWMNERIDTAINDGGLIQWSNRRNWGGFDGVIKGEWQNVSRGSLVTSVLAGWFWNHSGTKCVDETCSQIYRRDRGTGVIEGLSNRAGERNREERRQIRANLAWYKPNLAGANHEFKFGGDFFHTPANRSLSDRGPAKNYLLNFNNGVSDRIEILNAPVYPNNAGQYLGFYVSDSITIGRKLTLNLGARYAHDSIYENAGCREAAPAPAQLSYPASCWEKTQMPIWDSFVPRLRASYDITGDGKTVIKGGWGRYVRMRLFDHLQTMANNVISTMVYVRWRDLNNNRDYDPGEINLDPNGPDFSSISGTTFTSGAEGVVNPDEKQPYTDEYSVQFERQLIPDLAVRVTGIQARVSNVIRLANSARPYSSYNIPINSRDPGPDGNVNTTADNGGIITWYDYPASLQGKAFQLGTYVNDPKANEKYNSFEIAVSKRLSNNWQFQSAYSATKKDLPLAFFVDTFNEQNPNAEINAADKTWERTARLSGSYLFPYGILTSARFESRSGNPWARTANLPGGTQIPRLDGVRVELLGARRLPTVNLLSLRFEKRLQMGTGRELQLRTNLANVLNKTVPTSVTTLSGATFGTLTGQVLPRIINFEAEFRF